MKIDENPAPNFIFSLTQTRNSTSIGLIQTVKSNARFILKVGSKVKLFWLAVDASVDWCKVQQWTLISTFKLSGSMTNSPNPEWSLLFASGKHSLHYKHTLAFVLNPLHSFQTHCYICFKNWKTLHSFRIDTAFFLSTLLRLKETQFAFTKQRTKMQGKVDWQMRRWKS